MEIVQVIHILKNDDAQELSNYMPVSVLPQF